MLPGFERATYKQALRGLFITGTSDPSEGTKEKVGDEPGLTLRHVQLAAAKNVLNNLAGTNRK